MNINEAIQIHGADAVFTAGSAGVCEDFEPLRAMYLEVETIDDAEQISRTVYRSTTTEKKAAIY